MNEQKKKMEAPVLKIIRIDNSNVIATSIPIPPIPSMPKAETNETIILR